MKPDTIVFDYLVSAILVFLGGVWLLWLHEPENVAISAFLAGMLFTTGIVFFVIG